ncbi:Zn(II)2Cys6 transcription factor domain-containing protein [Aspergillus lucknowensis]|uniref:Zn(2)-C6 fungal-type domain-containing protein n=1 Tax=Aspergillus lucknowensis TaxID=176173 RepID=A0ABR4LDD6_9EURO
MASVPVPAAKRRKFHHKSRWGCAPCKKRRIKCDEKKPVCSNCFQRSVECSFKGLQPASKCQELSTVASANFPRAIALGLPAQLSDPGGLPRFCRRNTQDSELYYHFRVCTAAAFTKPGSPSLKKLFREDIPKLSASFPFLGHGLLSVAYIHLASMSQQETSEKLLTESAYHVNQALPGYLESIKNITAENSSALFGFAMFVVLISFANSSEEAGVLLQRAKDQPYKPEEAHSLSAAAARVAHCIQNIFGIFWRCQQWISSGPLSPAIRRYIPPALNGDLLEWIRVEDKRLMALSRLWEDDPTVTLAHSYALSASLTCLRDTFAMVTQLIVLPPPKNDEENEVGTRRHDLTEIHRELSAGRLDDYPSVFTWYIRLSPDFIGLMEEGNAYAMAVLAHYAIILDRACSDRWWACRLPQHFVSIAEFILGEDRRGWIEWPLMVVTDLDHTRG